MADPRFYRARGPFALTELASRAGAEIVDQADAVRQLRDVAPLDGAGPDDLSFLDNKRYLEALARTKAGAVILRAEHRDRLPSTCAALISADPYRSYALAAQAFYPFEAAPDPGIAASARIADSVRLGPGCQVDPGAVIMAGAEIGARTRIGANAVIGQNAVIGEDCSIGAGAHLAYCVLGNRVILHPGVGIGQDGFGFARGADGHVKVPQVGRVVIHDDVEIGANSTIDRGAGPDTIIGPGCMIDNLVQIGHNVQLGRGCVVVAQVGISGSTRLEDYVVLAGQVGIAGHLTLGKGAMVAAKSGVAGDLDPGQTYAGIPAVPGREWHRRTAILARLARRKHGSEV